MCAGRSGETCGGGLKAAFLFCGGFELNCPDGRQKVRSNFKTDCFTVAFVVRKRNVINSTWLGGGGLVKT